MRNQDLPHHNLHPQINDTIKNHNTIIRTRLSTRSSQSISLSRQRSPTHPTSTTWYVPSDISTYHTLSHQPPPIRTISQRISLQTHSQHSIQPPHSTPIHHTPSPNTPPLTPPAPNRAPRRHSQRSRPSPPALPLPRRLPLGLRARRLRPAHTRYRRPLCWRLFKSRHGRGILRVVGAAYPRGLSVCLSSHFLLWPRVVWWERGDVDVGVRDCGSSPRISDCAALKGREQREELANSVQISDNRLPSPQAGPQNARPLRLGLTGRQRRGCVGSLGVRDE